MKHLSFLKLMFLINLLTVCASSYAQTARVVDNKGTIRGIELGIGNVAEIYNAAVTQTINETFSNIDFATAGIVDASDFTTTLNSITINKAGRYEITYRVSTASTNNERNGGEFYLEVASTESLGTRAYTYSRNKVVGKNTVTVTKMINVVVPTLIRVKGHVYASNSNSSALSLTMVANGSSLIVKRIK
jgi:hypothetical protein